MEKEHIREYTEEFQKNFLKKIKEKVTNYICPICRNSNFIIIDGFLMVNPSKKIGVFALGGSTIPCVGLICNNCGFVAQHSIQILMSEKTNGKHE